VKNTGTRKSSSMK